MIWQATEPWLISKGEKKCEECKIKWNRKHVLECPKLEE